MSSTLSLSRAAIHAFLLGAAVLWAWYWPTAPSSPQSSPDTFTVGRQPDGSIVVPTNQVLRPAGRQVTFPGRPVDLAVIEDGKTLVVKNLRDLVFVDIATASVKQTLLLDRGLGPEPVFEVKEFATHAIGDTGKPGQHWPDGFSVTGLAERDGRVYVSDARSLVWIAEKSGGQYAWAGRIHTLPPKVGGAPNPAGLAFQSADELWTTTTRGNSVQLLNLARREPEQVVPVGVAPFTIVRSSAAKCYVSNWGGDPPNKGESQALSSGTPVRTDPKTGIAIQGTVSVIEATPGRWKQTKSIPVGLHPSGMVLSPKARLLYVANANSDTVSVIDTQTDQVVETIDTKPEARLPFGSGANALALSPDGSTLYVANGSNNCIAVVRLGPRARAEATPTDVEPTSRVIGLIPTGWYPGAVRVSGDGRQLYVVNIKGLGALAHLRPAADGHNTHDFLGSVQIVDVPDDVRLARFTARVSQNNRLLKSLADLDRPRPDVKPIPVPQRHGEPSVFEHVVYVIKENRSYDQILGDMKEGNGDPSLCLFGEEVTPNQHQLARDFVLLDNFYCSSTLSATGHQWVNEAYCVDYLTRTFGGFVRSYPVDGDDPLAFASSGFLWDNAMRHGKTFRNYGEFTHTTYEPKTATWTDVYNDFKNGTRRVQIEVRANVKPMAPYTHPGYGGFPLLTPDVYRAQMFLDELEKFQEKGTFPNLVYVFLPSNHTVGTRPGFPTPRAMVADNDVALGRIVEGITKSRFWPKTCIFVVEDDPQFGFDHVDGHRSVAQVISPFTRRRSVDSTNYNQTGMIKTIELILGLRPMNQLDLSATSMRNCFRELPDVTPYTALPNRVPLDQLNPPLEALQGPALQWAKRSLAMDLDEADEADEEEFNRLLWHSVRGYDAPYPEQRVRPR